MASPGMLFRVWLRLLGNCLPALILVLGALVISGCNMARPSDATGCLAQLYKPAPRIWGAGTMVGIYRIYEQGISPERALAEMPYFGFNKIWNNLFEYIVKGGWRKAVTAAGIPENIDPL